MRISNMTNKFLRKTLRATKVIYIKCSSHHTIYRFENRLAKYKTFILNKPLSLKNSLANLKFTLKKVRITSKKAIRRETKISINSRIMPLFILVEINYHQFFILKTHRNNNNK